MKSIYPDQQNKVELFFKPHWLVRQRHIQTIISSYVDGKGPALEQASREMILDVGSGVRLQGFYSPQPTGKSRGLVLLMSGWLGSAQANYMLGLGEYLFERGHAVFRLNFRDHGDTHHLNVGVFRGDLLDEAFGAAQQVAALEPNRSFHMFGVSMGGGFALRMAWRHSQTPIPNLSHTIAICPVVDPHHTVLALDNGFPLYLAYFRHKWRETYCRKQASFPDRYDFSELLATSSCMAMTDAFIPFTPYTTSLKYLKSYAVTPEMMAALTSPTTIIAAIDDPIIPIDDFYRFENISPYLNMQLQTYGGHVGFMDIFPLRLWLCQAVAAILGLETPQ